MDETIRQLQQVNNLQFQGVIDNVPQTPFRLNKGIILFWLTLHFLISSVIDKSTTEAL